MRGARVLWRDWRKAPDRATRNLHHFGDFLGFDPVEVRPLGFDFCPADLRRLSVPDSKTPDFDNIDSFLTDAEQSIRELVHVQRKVFRSRRETQMHDTVAAAVIWPPRPAFDTWIALEASINTDRVRLANPGMSNDS